MTLFEDQRLHRLAKDILTQAEVHRGAATASISVEDAQAFAEYARRQTQLGGPPPLIGDGYKATVCGVPVVVDETLKLGEFYTVGEESHTFTATTVRPGRLHRFVNRWLRRHGYVPISEVITGTVEWKRNEQPFVNLTVPGGQRLSGWVDSRIDHLR